MKRIRYGIIVLVMLLCSVGSSSAGGGVSINIGVPNLSIGINVPAYPELVPVPGYPVYYAPQVNANYFFYDGMYWVFLDDNWYASSWYNGPWALCNPQIVPDFILRIPVRYYRHPPAYFRGWKPNAAPHWGEHWGRGWEQNRRGWNKWNRSAAPATAPLPTYQRQYPQNRYPTFDQQRQFHGQQYRYQPHEPVVRQHYQQQYQQQGPHGGPEHGHHER